MTDRPGTENRSLRMDGGLWARFGAATAIAGINRASVLRDFARWYAREPRATLPRRPKLEKRSS